MDEIEEILHGLNDQQRKAVEATEGRVRVIAGAGSGKTRVLTRRYMYLTDALGINPANILCMTFTNKAAQEMRLRITKSKMPRNVNDFICTIHSFCLKVLRRDIYRLGYPKTFSIIDEPDQKDIARQVFAEFNVTRQNNTLDKFVKGITKYKSENKTEYIRRYMLPGNEITPRDQTESYLSRQASMLALDFNDIIHFAVYVLRTYKDVLDYWQGQLNYVMMDEAQDCNENDWALMEMLTQKSHNLFVVGAPDQAIYEWRGAVPKLFIDFHADTDIVLNRNYRSTPNILGAANSVIGYNFNRIPKDLFTNREDGVLVLHYHAKTEKKETEWIARRIKTLHEKGADLSDFAVLYRSSYLSRGLEQALIRKSLPYTIWGGVRFFERKEIKDTLAYLRMICFGDDLSFRRVVNEPSRKLGKVFMERLEAVAKKERLSLYSTLMAHIGDKDLNRFGAREFLKIIEDAKLAYKERHFSLHEFLDYVLGHSGLMDMYRTDGDEVRLENITELQQSVRAYEEQHRTDDITLADYLQEVALYSNEDMDRSKEAVKLMTIHQSKGLEFPYVFVMGMTEGIFPNMRTIRERKKDGEEEERRLMYVAVTRAEKALFLTESEGYSSAAQTDKYPSRFLLEIESKYMSREGKMDPSLIDGTKTLVANEKMAIEGIAPDDKANESESPFTVGMRVKHKLFGTGEVLAVNNDGSCNVRFETGERTIMPKFITAEE